eukprot:TRINITY_DN12756_c0_g1_i1.p2 TRINITY_DN12756_c0_g1~~TRINITY_DN12756_c0_g1_i1.p2  ORF type:complete len:132 (-),score=29.70 TRINITY_DN12756_c0_g1_i1:216-611(-)
MGYTGVWDGVVLTLAAPVGEMDAEMVAELLVDGVRDTGERDGLVVGWRVGLLDLDGVWLSDGVRVVDGDFDGDGSREGERDGVKLRDAVAEVDVDALVLGVRDELADTDADALALGVCDELADNVTDALEE